MLNVIYYLDEVNYMITFFDNSCPIVDYFYPRFHGIISTTTKKKKKLIILVVPLCAHWWQVISSWLYDGKFHSLSRVVVPATLHTPQGLVTIFVYPSTTLVVF